MIKVFLLLSLLVFIGAAGYEIYLIARELWLFIARPNPIRELQAKYNRVWGRQITAKNLKEKLPDNHPDHYRLDTVIDLAQRDMDECQQQIARIKLLELEEDV